MRFSHPKPFITKAVARQMAGQKTLPPPHATTITVEPYPTSYLLRLAYTAMPIPDRQLNADQRARFRAMIQR